MDNNEPAAETIATPELSQERVNILDDPAAMRTVALNAGDLSLAITQEVFRIVRRQHDDQAKALEIGLDRLVTDGLISTGEADNLKTMSRLVIAAAQSGRVSRGAATRVRTLYEAMAASPNSSPVALAIASAAKASLSPRRVVVPELSFFGQDSDPSLPPVPTIVTITPATTGAGALIGAVIGGIVGGLVGGFAGAALGATVGAVAGGSIGFCNKRNL